MRHPFLVPALVAAASAVGLVHAPEARADELPPEYSARHILVAYRGAERSEATRSKDEAKALAQKVAEDVRKPGADFAALSHASSDDKASDAQGGFLGIFEPGGMAQEFQKAVEGLKEGEISGVVESPFGFHVIQRLSVAEAKDFLSKSTSVFAAVKVAFGGPGNRTKEKALADATKAAAALKAGGAVTGCPAELGAEALKGGMPIVFHRGLMKMNPGYEGVEKAIWELAAGQTSDPIETKDGYWIVRRLPWFHARVSHLIVLFAGSPAATPGLKRTKEEAKARAAEALAKLTADPRSWAKVVAEYSEEPGAAARAGSLGTVEPGKMIPEFDAAILATPPGGMSGVVETQFGYHVIRRHD